MGVGEMASANTKKANHWFAFDSVTDLILAGATAGPIPAYLQFDGGC